MPFLSLFDITLETANKFYSLGWKLSVAGAAITAIGIVLLMLGTRIRDHDFESQVANLNSESAKARERAAIFEADAENARKETEKLKK